MTDPLDRELEQLLRGREPRAPNRRPRLAILGVVGVLLVAAFLTLARLSKPPRTTKSSSCAAVLHFRGRTYDGTKVRAGAFTQFEAIGVGTVPPCGSTQAALYDVRSLVGVSPALAVALPGPNDVVYVARGHCRGLGEARLERCLRRGG
jgi:hypothetical protein